MQEPWLPHGAGAALARPQPARPRVAILCLALLAVTGPTRAADWSLEPTLRLSETWTDNVDLSEDDPEEEWITEFAPGLRLSGEGRRVQADLAYELQHLVHANDSGRDRTNHRLNGEGSAELVRERLFFDAGASRSRNTGGPLVAAPSNSVVAQSRRDTITTWQAGPRLQYELGRFARIDAEARREQIDFGSRDRGESTADVASLGVTSGPMFPDWGWALGYNVREEDETGEVGLQQDTRLARARAELNWRVGAATQLFAAGGEEDNEFESADEGDPVDGSFWEAGFRWNPSRNVSVEAAAGERFFGDTARASVNVVGRALSLRLNVAEDLVTTPQLQLEQVTALLVDDQGNPVLGPNGQPVTVVVDVPTVVDDVILQRRADLQLAWDYSHTRLSLSLQGTDREFQRLGTSERSNRADLEWQWTRLTRTTITAGVGFIEQEFAETDREDEVRTYRLRAERQLRGETRLTADIEQLERTSTNSNAEYQSLRATVGLNLAF